MMENGRSEQSRAGVGSGNKEKVPTRLGGMLRRRPGKQTKRMHADRRWSGVCVGVAWGILGLSVRVKINRMGLDQKKKNPAMSPPQGSVAMHTLCFYAFPIN